jgi:hypothetical protein
VLRLLRIDARAVLPGMSPRVLRVFAIALVSAGLAMPTVASAAPLHPAARHVTCNLLTDPPGDTQSAVPDNDSELDLLGGDIVTSQRWVTAVIRLKALTAEDFTEPAGRIWEFDFTANGKNFILMGALLAGGSEFEAYISDQRIEKGKSGARAATGIGTLKGTIDTKHRAVWLTGPLSIFKKYVSMSNTYLDHLALFTYRAHGESMQALPTGKVLDISASFGIGVDEAWSSRHYVPTAPSCIPAGK